MPSNTNVRRTYIVIIERMTLQFDFFMSQELHFNMFAIITVTISSFGKYMTTFIKFSFATLQKILILIVDYD